MGVFLYICCIFSKDLFPRTPLEGCFLRLLFFNPWHTCKNWEEWKHINTFEKEGKKLKKCESTGYFCLKPNETCDANVILGIWSIILSPCLYIGFIGISWNTYGLNKTKKKRSEPQWNITTVKKFLLSFIWQSVKLSLFSHHIFQPISNRASLILRLYRNHSIEKYLSNTINSDLVSLWSRLIYFTLFKLMNVFINFILWFLKLKLTILCWVSTHRRKI